MQSTLRISLIITIFISLLSPNAEAAKIKLKLNKALGAAHTIVAINDVTGKTSSQTISATSKSATITISGPSRIYLRSTAGKIVKALAANKCSGKQFTTCSKRNVANLFKGGTVSAKVSTSSPILLSTISGSDYSKAVKTSSFVKFTTLTTSLNSKGQASTSAASLMPATFRAGSTSGDSDGDGLPEAIDSDDDGDSVLDNYDSSNSSSTATFNVFSNFKTEIDNTINVNALGTLTTDQIDSQMSQHQSLAIAVAGGVSDTSELDCGSLGYCSSGGTGRTSNQSFPGTAGGSFDPDSDGFGTITRGGTGDFQLTTGATSSQIGAGDTLIQHVTSGGVETEQTGMLNFVFVTNPAAHTLATTAETATIDYTVTPRKGSRQNCLLAPASGDVELAITGWRPQRPGNSAAGEGTYVDIGHSSINIDIPNGACSSPNGGCSTQGAGHCGGSSFTTSDPNLTVAGEGLTDNKDDQDASTSNTYSFYVNLTSCLNNATSGPVSWTSGQTLFIDLQFQSQYGDNAAQKFCITRQ